MINYLNIIFFHFKIHLKNSYFLSTLFISTTSFLLILFQRNYSSESIHLIFLKSSIWGFWSLCVVSSGLINFQKFQETLKYILNTKTANNHSLLLLTLPIVLLANLSFIVSYILCTLLYKQIILVSLYEILCIVILNIAAISVTSLTSLMFVFTRNAIIYEQLINTPIMLILGLTGLTLNDYSSKFLTLIIPLKFPIDLLLKRETFHFIGILSITLYIIIWLMFSNKIINLAIKKSKIEVI